MTSYESIHYTSLPTPCGVGDAASPTLQQALQDVLPEHFPSSTHDGQAGQQGVQPQTQDGDSADGSAAETQSLSTAPAAESSLSTELAAESSTDAGLSAAGSEAQSQATRNNVDVQVLIHGITPDLQTPIAWLHALFHAPDYFVYVVVRLQT